MSYKKSESGEVVASKDFQRMPQAKRKGWLGSQEVPTHRLVEPKAKKGEKVVWSGELERIPEEEEKIESTEETTEETIEE
jgi:hypothetical protein